LSTGEKFFTRGKNIKAPSLELVCEWLVKAWDSIPEELISKSFKSCGITNDLNGEEDDRINCLRPGEACEEGFELLKKKQRDLENVLLLAEGDAEEDFHNINEIYLESDEELNFE